MKKNNIDIILDKLELILFFIGIVLQDFAIIKVGTAGVSLILVVCIFISIRHNFLNKFKISGVLLVLIIFIKVCIDKLFLVNIPIMSIVRLAIIIFIPIISYKYTEYVIERYGLNKLNKILIIIATILMIYGIYSIVAFKFRLPLFLNIFRNNPSYFVSTGMYNYFGGWVENMRLFTTFAEPSMYSYFLVIIINIIYSSEISKCIKILLYILTGLNLYHTYSRTGYAILAVIIFIILIYNLLSLFINKNSIYKILLPFIIMSPIINILIMYITNNTLFTDLSSLGRTNSAIYYLMKSFSNIEAFIFGHGYKSIQLGYDESMFSYGIEAFTHNGYVEIVYEFGYIFLFILLFLLIKYVSKIPKIELRLISITTIIYGCAFSSFFNIESIVSLYSVILCSYKFIDDRR